MTQIAAIRRLSVESAKALAVRPIGLLVGFIVHVYLARTLSVEEYGAFVYVYFLTYLLGRLCRLGFERSFIRYGTPLLATGDHGAFNALARHALASAGTLGLVAGLLLAVLAIVLPAATAATRQCFLAGALLVPLLALHNVYEGFALAMKRSLQASVPEQVLRQLLLGVLAWAAFDVFEDKPTALAATLAHAGALIVTLGVDVMWYRISRPRIQREVPPVKPRREWSVFALQMAAVTNMGAWIMQCDLFVVGAWLGVESAGTYSIAVRLAGLVAAVGATTALIAGPFHAVPAAAGDSRQRQATFVARLTVALSLPAALAIWILRDPLIAMFGPGHAGAATVLGILLAGYAARDAFGPALGLLAIGNAQAMLLRALAVAVAANAALNVLGVGLLGTVGAALATAATVTGYSAALRRMCISRLAVDTAVWPARRRSAMGAQ